MDLTGKHLGKYKLLEKAGQGGMAYVYKALQPTIDRHVAVKVLHSHLADDPQFLERFKREAKGLGSLRHPHIVSVIDFDVDDGWYYMVMDFVEGETLQTVLERRGVLPVDEALRLTAQLAGALAYAHRHGRIHRDIKPGNVMFADAAQQHPVITDFGLIRLLDNATITLSGTIAGTPAYMSPEAAQGHKVDARSDIYSLGVMLYEMVTGKRPYTGETPLSVIMKLVLEPLPPPLSLNPDLPPTVVAILNKATAKQPDERYQTAAEMREAILELGIGNAEFGMENVAQDEAEGDGGGTQVLQPGAESIAAAAGETPVAAQKPSSGAKPRLLPRLAGAGILILLLALGFVYLNGDEGEADAAPTVVATAAQAVLVGEATPLPQETAVSAAGGALRFAEADDNNLRQYTLSIDDVPPPPAGSHYELWFDFADQAAPENVAEVAAQNGRITYADVLVSDLAGNVSGVRISIEPDFDDDPTISGDIVYTGPVTAETGLAEIKLFAHED